VFDGLHLLGLGGHAKPGDLNSCQRREIADICRMFGWQSEGANLLGQSKPPVVLHCAAVVGIALRMPAAVTLLVDDRAGHTQLVELQGKDHPDGTAPNDDHGHSRHEMIVR